MHRHKKRILFICKRGSTYGFSSTYCRRSSGLYNSTQFIATALEAREVEARVVEVTDNNDIDRAITYFDPHLVVIEALWVVPEKFSLLKRLHPTVRWFVHLHSHIPFLALEGIAIQWLTQYGERGVGTIVNSPKTLEALSSVLPERSLRYLPNVYGVKPQAPKPKRPLAALNIGCFGALRPMKNQLLQALASLELASKLDLPLRFHINAARVETGGEPVLKNLRALLSPSELVEHPWLDPVEFRALLRSEIDLGLQISLSETFNVVSADYIASGIPIVVSPEVPWASRFSQAAPDSIRDMVRLMHRALDLPQITLWNQYLLGRYSARAARAWFKFALRA